MLSYTWLLLALPLVLAQTTNTITTAASSPSQTVITSTSFATQVTLGDDRQASTVTRTFVFTTTQNLTPQQSITGNNTSTANSTTSASTTTTPSNLPTAPTDIDGGGQGGAPVPGQTNVGGIGPDDNYIAGASALNLNAWIAGVLGVAIGGAMAIY